VLARAEFDMTSKKAGTLQSGEELKVRGGRPVPLPAAHRARVQCAPGGGGAGARAQHDATQVLEIRTNEKGIVRVHFQAAKISGWCSTKASDGTVRRPRARTGAALAPRVQAEGGVPDGTVRAPGAPRRGVTRRAA
jgi:hypothetical protein